MARKRRLVVTRNGEHVAWPESREAAEAEIERLKAVDLRMLEQGWISQRQHELTRYFIETTLV